MDLLVDKSPHGCDEGEEVDFEEEYSFAIFCKEEREHHDKFEDDLIREVRRDT